MDESTNVESYWSYNYTGTAEYPVSIGPMSKPGNQCTGIDVYHEMYQKCLVDMIGHGYITPVICAVGMVLNALNVLVLVSSRLQESCYVHLHGLAWADLLSLFFFFTNSIGRGHFPDSLGWNLYEIYVYFTLGSVTTFASIFLTVSVSVERFIYIYKPYKAKVLCVPPIARKVVVVIWIFSAVLSVPRFFIFEANEYGQLQYTAFGNSIYYRIISWIYFILVSLGCCVVLIVLNILLIRGIRRTNNKRRSMTGRKGHKMREERRLTLTLISIICVFIIGELPSAFISRHLLVPMAGPGILDTLGYKIAASVATVLVVLQHSLNFVMYCVFNKRFWQVFKQRMCGCALKRVGEDSSPFEPKSNTGESQTPVSLIHTNCVNNGVALRNNRPTVWTGNV